MDTVRDLMVMAVDGPIPRESQRYHIHWWAEDGQEWGGWFDLLPRDADPTPIFDEVMHHVLEAGR